MIDQTNTNHHKHTYPFHILKASVVLQCLSELDMDLTEDELRDPAHHKEKVKALFQSLVEPCLGICLDGGTQAVPSAITDVQKSFSYPEVHDESILETHFFFLTKKFMNICGIPDFSLRDLFAPTSKRLRIQLSGAINFIKFREERITMYAELVEQKVELNEQLNVVNDEHAMVMKELEDTKAVCSSKWKELEDIEFECEEIKSEIAQQNKLQASIRHESGQLKKKVYELKESNAITSLALEEAQAEKRKLSSRVVQSPERIKRAMAEVKKSLDTERALYEQSIVEAEKAKQRVKVVTEATNNVSKLVKKIVGKLEVQLNKHNAAVEELEGIKENIQINDAKMKDINNLIEKRKEQINHTRKKINQLHATHNKEMSHAQAQLDETRAKLTNLEKGLCDKASQVQSYREKIKFLEKNIHQTQKDCDAEVSEMIAAYKRLEVVIVEKEKNWIAALRDED